MIKGWIVSIAACFAFAGTAIAQETAPRTPQEQAAADAWQRASDAMIEGPSVIELKDQATLALPASYGFIPKKEAVALMDLMGNDTGETFIGLVFPLADEKGYFFTLDYEHSGYISDEDAKDWDTDELFQSLKDGTEAANVHREKQGVPPIVVTRWIETPAYESATHRLVWAAEVRLKHGEDRDPGVNYNTYVLGREGYVSLNLVTAASTVENDKPAAHELLQAISFNGGRQYGDFNSSTDKVAAYGLAALVGGIAAKKLGLLALIAATAVKFGKLILVAIAALGGWFAKWFKGRSSRQDPTS